MKEQKVMAMIKKIVGISLMGIIMISSVDMVSALDSNHTDYELSIVGMYPWTVARHTAPRTKYNYTPVYVKVIESPNCGQQLFIRDKNDYLVSGVALAHVGQEYFFKFRKANSMQVRPCSLFEYNTGTMTGKWSPDRDRKSVV